MGLIKIRKKDIKRAEINDYALDWEWKIMGPNTRTRDALLEHYKKKGVRWRLKRKKSPIRNRATTYAFTIRLHWNFFDLNIMHQNLILAHELWHWSEKKKWGIVKWYMRYVFSQRRRFAMEVAPYRQGARMLKEFGAPEKYIREWAEGRATTVAGYTGRLKDSKKIALRLILCGAGLQ